jgi:hypothetical protein
VRGRARPTMLVSEHRPGGGGGSGGVRVKHARLHRSTGRRQKRPTRSPHAAKTGQMSHCTHARTHARTRARTHARAHACSRARTVAVHHVDAVEVAEVRVDVAVGAEHSVQCRARGPVLRGPQTGIAAAPAVHRVVAPPCMQAIHACRQYACVDCVRHKQRASAFGRGSGVAE